LVNSEEEILFCPSCQTVTMLKCGSADADLIIDRCGECQGLWFDGGEIRQFLKSDNFKGRFLANPKPSAPAGEVSADGDCRRDCPRCQRGLEHLSIAEVTVDVCLECLGVWLDSGELAQLVQAGKNSQLEDDDSLLAHEIREGLSSGSLSPNLLAQLMDALKDLLARYK
jgi:Zn-finger nucleic acid-binding protein